MQNHRETVGHPSWHHWNWSFWIVNDDDLYTAAQQNSREAFIQIVRYTMSKTPDGAPFDADCIGCAWDQINHC